jgi:asparagine synthase (glutamine-hydrolysing)
MSGIVGIVNLDGKRIDHDLLSNMTRSLSFRGPDQTSVWIQENVGFGHALLKTKEDDVLDQPHSLDGRTWVTAHARIDGRKELTAKLKASGATLEPDPLISDSELILFAYQLWGRDCLQHLVGDFSFAIWDGPGRQLFCARDQMGIGQFYYAASERVFVFSNTLNCLRLHPAVSSRLNDVAIGDFLIFGLNQDETSSIFSDIRRLPKAHSLSVTGDEVRTNKYWTPKVDAVRYKTDGEYIERFSELLRASVGDRLRTSNVGIAMSGGLDSSMIAATARNSGNTNLTAYCVTYERAFVDEERHYATEVARSLEMPIEFLDAYSINQETSPRTRGYAPEPFDVEPFYVVSDELMSRMSTDGRVALTGWDGDTFMNESPKYLFYQLWQARQIGKLSLEMLRYSYFRKSPPPIGLRTWWQRRNTSLDMSSMYPSWINDDFAKKLNLVDRWKQSVAERQLAHDTRPHAFRILDTPNWNALFAGFDPGVTRLPLEVRHPLIDLRLVNYLLGLPIIPWVIDKHILREAMRGILPEGVRRRQKTPLAGDPGMQLRYSTKASEIDSFLPTPELSNYVQREAVPLLTTETDRNSLWINARAFSLNQWFKYSYMLDTKSPMEGNDGNGENSHTRWPRSPEGALHQAKAG